jgi:hypothetical protein
MVGKLSELPRSQFSPSPFKSLAYADLLQVQVCDARHASQLFQFSNRADSDKLSVPLVRPDWNGRSQ